MVDVKFRSLVYELKEELKGLWGVVLAGAIGPLIFGWELMAFISPLPLAIAALVKGREKGIGPAILLGAVLGYLVKVLPGVVLGFLTKKSIWHFVPLTFSLVGLFFYTCFLIAPDLLWLPIAWVLLASYPAYVVLKRSEDVPRLLWMLISAVLTFNSVLPLTYVKLYSPKLLELKKHMYLADSIVSSLLILMLALVLLFLKKGRNKLLAFLVFYFLTGSILILPT